MAARTTRPATKLSGFRSTIPTGRNWGSSGRLSFLSKPPRADSLRVYYAWSTGHEWTAPDSPRFAFTGWPYLYKLQLSCNQAPGTYVARDDACRRFLKDFLPALKPHLVAPFTP